jgi:uncharacterized flavoprotein (TIGR03862 family)
MAQIGKIDFPVASAKAGDGSAILKESGNFDPVIIIGAGPAGLMAAEVLTQAGIGVEVFDRMATPGRKFLLAGRGGLNLTHSEDLATFATRFGSRSASMAALMQDFGPRQVCQWALELGVPTFVGSSGRVFPVGMKAAPLLRAWLLRLRHPASGTGARFHMRHRWTGWAESGELCFDAPDGQLRVTARALVLALGGGSWAHLGSDGAWLPVLQERGVAVAPLIPANCGFDVQGGWSNFFAGHFAGAPFKSVAISVHTSRGQSFCRKGEFVVTRTGVEGSLIYAAASLLRDEILEGAGVATLLLDLLPDFSLEQVCAAVRHPRGSRSLSSHLKSRLRLDGVKAAVLHELLPRETFSQPEALAAAIKALPVRLQATRPLDEAISSAGGVQFEGLTNDLMLAGMPGVFCAGEMLDWEAPTGGYLLTGCFASGARVGNGVLRYLRENC